MELGHGYLRYPAINGDTVVFASEDDLWTVPVTGGRAWRLTAGVAEASHPRLSPDGSMIAFVGRDEGPTEAYVMPSTGGTASRLTFHGAQTTVVGWDGDAIVYTTNAGRPFARDSRLHRIDAVGGAPEPLGYGPATAWSPGPSGGVVLGRSISDPARWKRYRGGTAGTIWIDSSGTGDFDHLVRLDGNLANPCWVGDRIFFLSDHEGVGNIYSTTPDGKDLRRHTDHDRFYARNLSTDGARLVYQCAARLYVLSPATEPERIDVETGSSRAQRNRRFVPAGDFLEHARLGPDGSDVALTSRGKAFSFAHWEGAVSQHGEPDGVRYRLLNWLDDHQRLVAVQGDESDQERIVVLTADGSQPPRVLTDIDIGHCRELVVAPHGSQIALANHRCELLLLDLDRDNQPRVVDHNPYGPFSDLTWAPDGRWLAYGRPRTMQTREIALCAVETGETWPVTQPVLQDFAPAFDPEGKYLYFLGYRDLDPVYDTVQFELSFPLGCRPYAVTLRADVGSPFVPEPRPVAGEAASSQQQVAEEHDVEADIEADRPRPIRIDTDGIEQRIVAFPMPLRRYTKVAGLVGKVLTAYEPIEGALAWNPLDTEHRGKSTVEVYTFAELKSEKLLDGVSDFWLDRSHHTLLYRDGNRLRVLKAGEKPPAEDGDEPGRTSGWIDLDRVKVCVRPGAEWRQLFREAWRLQRDYFWTEDMSGVEWAEIYQAYLGLVDRVASRSELSDLVWEFQGELGSSHAYEVGGEYRPGPQYRQGFLAANWRYDDASERYQLTHIAAGDPWDAKATSPLRRPGVDVRVGDEIVAINGQQVGRAVSGATAVSPEQALVNQADQEVRLTLVRGGGEPRTVTVRALGDERPARYRDWVTANRAAVHERTDGRVGYLHVPNMLAMGFAEFHRAFLAEYDREALLVDVRYNGGGHVSGLVLEKLARRRLGYVFSRWTKPSPYPDEAPRGPMVALTNEHAGSDGDIFSHAFKQLGLGPLIGKRTWGGVIGIEPMHALSDGTVTTQPAYAFAFDDVGWQVENYGTDPDIDIDIAPQDYARDADPQLDRAIMVVLDQLAQHPPHTPNPVDRPRLGPTVLPPRP